MQPKLYQRVVVNRDVPDENLQKGDVAWLIDYFDVDNGSEKCAVLEVFNIFGEHLKVAIVPAEAVSALSADLIPTARPA